MNTAPLLQVEELTASYGAVAAVRDLNLSSRTLQMPGSRRYMKAGDFG